MRKILITGSSGLIGSEIVEQFCQKGWLVSGIDNNMRQNFFGAMGDTRWNQQRLCNKYPAYKHIELDIRDREGILNIVSELKPEVIVHAAAQPSHDLAAVRPFDDFDINAVGTLNLLEATRQVSRDIIFIYLSSNKVYGDSPNSIQLRETATRWDYSDPEFMDGIDENFPVDQSKHSLFGASKLAADILVQEYGRYFNMHTCCLRGGCLTGPNHSGVQQHGFLSYLIRSNLERKKYTIFGYKGKQVRDNIHAYDVCSFIELFIAAPRSGEVYNIGGGRTNSISILEAFTWTEQISGIPMVYDYQEKNRNGDHICYISNLNKIKSHFPDWKITKDLMSVFTDIHDSLTERILNKEETL